MVKRRTLKPSAYGGFILGFEPARTESIEEYLLSGWRVSESFSSQDWNLQSCEMVYLVRHRGDVQIFGATLMKRRGRGGGTKRVEMRFTQTVLFDWAISSSEASNADGLSRNISSAENVKRLNAKAWEDLNQLVKRLRPEYSIRLDELLALRVARRPSLGSDERSVRLAEERDAFGLALDIAGMKRSSILASAGLGRMNNARSTLDLIDAQPIAERSLVESDSRIFRIALRSAFQNAKIRDDRGREIRAYVLDSTPLETATGVDLLLYQQQFESFLLLQYKGMHKDHVVEGWSYPVDGTNLQSQLATMTRIRKALPVAMPKSLKEQRLCEEPFYFKFCERRLPLPEDESLVPGITMSASHVEHFLSLPEAVIQGHGRRVGYENCPRYFNNSEFVSLARGGWIGCKGATTAAISSIIGARDAGRVAILAVIAGLALKAENRGRR